MTVAFLPDLAPPAGGPPPAKVVLIGDLQEAGTGGTAVNDAIMGCFRNQNGTTCETFEEYTPPKKDTIGCEKDTCCIWSYIKDDLVPLFTECDGTCNDIARASVRFGFHDAAAWHQNLTHGGKFHHSDPLLQAPTNKNDRCRWLAAS